uniref:Protein GDAP2 isogeny n=1 Tax=Cajanus cajan TaxID=3821 RepID=A0A151TFF5_CAJCA|nr:Protein GDAP2 isogeny [Cajanus cajan]
MYRPVASSDSATPRGGLPNDSGDSVVTLDQVPRWIDAEHSLGNDNGDSSFSSSYFPDPLTFKLGLEGGGGGSVSRFPVDHEVNSKIYLWRGNPWNLEVDAVVNSTNEILDEAHSSPGLHAAAGPGLAEECATLGGCRTGMAKVTNAYDLPARKVIHTVGPKYAVKYHTAAENALSHCYRSCLELLIENGLKSIAMGCIYTETKKFWLQNGQFRCRRELRPNAKLRCRRELRQYVIKKYKFRCHILLIQFFGEMNTFSFPQTFLRCKPNKHLKSLLVAICFYRGGVDSEGRPVMVVVGAHFLLRCLDLERFVLYVVKEFEPIIQKPYTIVYFHSAASLQVQPDLGWMRRLQQILGRKHQHNLHAIYVLHPTLGLKLTVLALQLLVDNLVWKKVVYVDRLLQLFRYVPREQLTIPDFVFQHDLEVNGGKGLIVDPRTKYVYHRP